MENPALLNPLTRFAGLADRYAKYRPSYPAAAIDFILVHCGLGPQSVVVDVGCGTGISSRLLAERGVAVIGIEPNTEMRRKAESEPAPPGAPGPSYREGRAEATNLPANIADAVLAAQAFHWFEPEAALREFRRILKPGGWAVLLANERDESDPFTAAYSRVIRTAPDAAAIEGPRARSGSALLTSPLFQHGQRVLFHSEQCLDEDGLLGRAFSASYAPREREQAERFAADLRGVFVRFENAGKVTLKYQTAVIVAARR